MHSSTLVRALGALGIALVLAAAPAQATKRRAFVTSVSGIGNLFAWGGSGGATGLDAGDSICRTRATIAGLPNADTYRAWLSTSTTDAYCHVQGLTGKKATGCNGAPQPGGGPWYLFNGATHFTADLAALTSPEPVIYRAVTTDEFGAPVTFADQWIWTGTYADGQAASTTCQDWTSGADVHGGRHGGALYTVNSWTDANQGTCDELHRLLCFEPGASEPAVLGWSPAALVFVTSAVGLPDLSTWPQAGGQTGLAAGDQICRSLAAEAGLPAPSSFVAWLSDGTTSAIDRLTLGDQVSYRRVDGYGVGSRAEFAGAFNLNSIHVDERGDYVGEHFLAWTGSDGAGAALGVDCDGWETASGTEHGGVGSLATTRTGQWSGLNQLTCNWWARLYCFSHVVTLFWDGFEYTGDASRWSSAVP